MIAWVSVVQDRACGFDNLKRGWGRWLWLHSTLLTQMITSESSCRKVKYCLQQLQKFTHQDTHISLMTWLLGLNPLQYCSFKTVQ